MSEEAASATPKSIEVKNFVDSTKLKKDLGFSMANLSGAMVDQASMFAHYATLAAKASMQVDQIDLRLDIVKAQVGREIRDEYAKTGAKITVSDVESFVLTSERVIRLRKALNAAKQVESNAKAMVEAFRHRRDMLVQLGAHEREEMKGTLSVTVKNLLANDLAEKQTRAAKLALGSNKGEVDG